jgi:hypothetical protein
MRAWLVAVLALLPAGRAAAQSTTANPHGTLRQGMDCEDCHTPASWKSMPAQLKFDHNRETRFALTGKHAGASCARCHLDLRFDEPKVSGTQCATCHADVHRGSLAGECVRCHTTASFRDVPALAIHSRTAFPLSGAHLQAPCESCHRTERNGAYSAVARECAACHQAARASASAVDHSGFPADCTQCHSPFSWSGGVAFDHGRAARGFALEGAHGPLRCQTCHLQGTTALRFNPRPTGPSDCFACHQPDYQRVHAGSGFPTTCNGCHDVNSWSSGFDHDGRFFPINSGAHRGEWQTCATCHTAPGDFKVFTCLTCHEHSQTSMDSKHRERAGYAYDSQACYRCHPRGKH